MNESELPLEVEKRTGVHVDYKVVASESRAENFAVLLASDDLCDMMCNVNFFWSGNVRDAVVKDNYFVNLYDYRQYMPDYIYEATKDPNDRDTIKAVFTEDDLILAAYCLKDKGQLPSGPLMRGDWLDKMGKTYTDIVTFDDLHEVLMFFKSQLGIEHPTSIYKTLEVVGCNEWVGYDTYCFCSGVPQALVVDGKVRLANMNQNDYDLMPMLNGWYNEGIFDPNWSSYSGCADLNDKIKASQIGYIIGGGISIAAHNDVIPADAKVGWVPVSKPLRYRDQTLHLGFNLTRLSWGSTWIAASCENIPLCCAWLDWRYSEEGSFLYGYGIEGLTYEYDENGQLWITDYIVNHPAYWGMIMCIYSLNHVTDGGLKIDFSMNMKINKDVPGYLDYWMSTPHDNKYVYPTSISYTSEQSSELAQYGGDVGTYVEENYIAFVDGSKPLSEWDGYVEGLYAIGVQKIIDNYQ
jgi:putative aldouronate transport system substrate-binding protein